ncbi:MAG: phenol 2-monooxygenase [Jatrophihabitans sp.]|uniref:phenol 2-monooxygenase n=1 Tax=Jatrophihabitans sp. TaxID=1932789 RepID=UPI003F81800E
MQYELRQQVIEPERPTFTPLIARYGGRPATRYEEASIGVQPRENFHYRPLWDPQHEIYDETYSELRLSDPDAFTDPRQYYYTPYVSHRAALHDAFGKSLDYVGDRTLLQRLPEGWRAVVQDLLLPLRYYESGAQLLLVNGARFAYGTTVEQCLSFAAFDRIGNAQLISRIGIALGENTDAALAPTKQAWLDDDGLQGLRRYVEELLVEPDWAVATVALDLVDRLLFPLITRELDEAALLDGAGAYSLLVQHLATWYTDNRKWLDALTAAWRDDPEHADRNRAVLDDTTTTWQPRAEAAVAQFRQAIQQRGVLT